MANLTAHLHSITNAQTVETLWTLHTDRMASYRFDRIIYGFTHYRSGCSQGDPQDWVLLTNHGDSDMGEFLGKGHLYNAPMIHWALANTKVGMSQDEVEEIWAKHGDEITVINNVMHLKIQTLPYSLCDRV